MPFVQVLDCEPVPFVIVHVCVALPEQARVIVIVALFDTEIFPAASLAQAYNVFAPDEVNVNDVGTEVSQVDDVVGAVDDSDR